MTPIIEKFVRPDITEEMICQAADLFSSNYGTWGMIAVEKMGVKQGETSLHTTFAPIRLEQYPKTFMKA
jgi:hypothetical protein